MKAKLCRCNKCDTVMIDQNPQINTTEFEVPSNATDMQFIDAKDGGFWACPVCEDDGYLMDITEESQIPAAPSTPLVDKQPEMTYKVVNNMSEMDFYTDNKEEAEAKYKEYISDYGYGIRLYEAEKTADDEEPAEWELIEYFDTDDNQPESKQPLYKVLNEQRTQGEVLVNFGKWSKEQSLIFGFALRAKGKDIATYNVTTQGFIQPDEYFEIYPDLKETHCTQKECEANAQYTALAVNNLHILAEALEACKSELYSIHSQYGDKKHALDNCDALKKAEQALNNIS